MQFDYAPLQVLIVEDHEYTRLLIKDVLENLGCSKSNICEADDGSSALTVLKEKRVHLIISDWKMEPMDGLTFVRTLRDPQKSEDPFVPFILCTAFTDRDLIERARDMGVTEVMAKPITVKAIDEKVRSIIESPRPFVDSSQYFGPDRRRRSDGVAPDVDRRKKRRTVIKQVEDPEALKNAGG